MTSRLQDGVQTARTIQVTTHAPLILYSLGCQRRQSDTYRAFALLKLNQRERVLVGMELTLVDRDGVNAELGSRGDGSRCSEKTYNYYY